tara:strand:- start:293 stop:520 length:228 start_codon:yes stop_codon:yes gene_type:complete
MKYYVSKFVDGRPTRLYSVVNKLSEIEHEAGDRFLVLKKSPDKYFAGGGWISAPVRLSDGEKLKHEGDIVFSTIR